MGMGLAALLTSICVFLLAQILFERISRGAGGGLTFRGRVFSPKGAGVQPAASIEKKYHYSNIASLQSLIGEYPLSQKILTQLKRAGLKISVSVFFLSCVLLGGIVFLFFSKQSVILAVSLALGSALAPMLFLWHRNKLYVEKFSQFFADGLLIMSGSLKAGHGTEAAFREVTASALYPVSVEFETMENELRFGIPLVQALENLYQRIPTHEVKIMVTALAIQSQFGGSLSEILMNLQAMIRERFGLQREIRALSSQGRFTALILAIFPFVISLFLFMTDRETFVGFFTSPVGKIVLGIAIGDLIVSHLWIRQIVKITD